MSKIKFNDKELELIKTYSVQQSLASNVLFYFCVLFAPMSFAIYGLIKNDVIALCVAFLGLLIFVFWLISRSLKGASTFTSACQKIIEFNHSNKDAKSDLT